MVHSVVDRAIAVADDALRTVWGRPSAARPLPRPPAGSPDEGSFDAAASAALMRVNHVGEVCAQALYAAQAVTARDPAIAEQMAQAAREETDHLAWTRERLQQLGGRTSWLNPLWYAGSFAIGLVAGRIGDRVSLGFVIETERQVERHLSGHMERLPAGDTASRAIVEQMREDEIRHGLAAERAGGVVPPAPVRALMRVAAKLMTTTAHRI